MKNNILVKIKIAITAACAALTAWLGILAVPVYILVLLNIIDYFTGLTAAPYRGEERNSNKGFRGIAKKVCMLLLVALGGIVDWLLMYAAQTLGITVPLNFLIGAVVAIWLICNELVSILENIGDIGVNPPAFLCKLIEWVRKAAENQADIDKTEDTKNG